jgi:hypothetical protein
VAKAAPRTVNEIAWTCALGTAALDDYGPLLRAAEEATAGPTDANRLNTLGALLYRAGRFADAVRQLERSVDAHGAGGTAHDALFLAMAHGRLGHGEEARIWLRRGDIPVSVATFNAGANGDTPWIPRLELDFLRREAAATVGALDR